MKQLFVMSPVSSYTDHESNKVQQRVVLNGQFSSWADVNAGVSQGFILGPVLFLTYINVLSNLDYGDIIYEQAFNSFFNEKLESIQYHASLAITGGIRATSRKKLYNELGFQSLHARRCRDYSKHLCLPPFLRIRLSFMVSLFWLVTLKAPPLEML